MKKTILILLTVLLAVSCSQVVYKDLPLVDIEGSSTTISAIQQDETSRNLVLTFAPVPYVSAYAYSFNGGNPIPFEADEYENGMLSYSIYAARIPSNNGYVKLFGRTSGSTSWVELGESPYEMIEVEGGIPDVYVYERNIDNVVLKVNQVDSGKTYLYKTVVMTEDGEAKPDTEFAQASDNKITISNLNPDEIYFVNVYQKETLGAPDPEIYAAIEVPVFEHEVKLSLSTNENGFVVSGIENGTQEIQLKNRDNESLSVVKNVETISNGSVEIQFSDVPSLESGLFYVYSTNGSVVSNNVKTTTPVSILSTTPNYRSVDLKINFSSRVDVSSIKFSANDSTTTYSADVVSVDPDNKTTISITDLDSNTTYNTDQIILAIDGIDIAISEFTTKSFAGNNGAYYKWEGDLTSTNNTNFIIYVDNKPEGSDYPYYVYFSGNDDSMTGDDKTESYSKSKYRLMPLVDNSEGLGIGKEPTISGFVNTGTGKDNKNVDFSLQNYAFQKNENKWKNPSFSSLSPTSWDIPEKPVSQNDKVTTITYSGLFGSDPSSSAETDTTFSFEEKRLPDGSIIPFVRFENIGKGLVSMGLETNKKTTFPEYLSIENGGNTWCLGLVEDVEGEVK